MTYPQLGRNTATRGRGRMSYQRASAHEILDEAYHCHVGFTVDGEPRVLPTLHVRVGETVYVHGSTGSRMLLAARGEGGLPVCLTVTLLDGMVFGRAQFHHSANYRSVVAHGVARPVTDEAEKRRVLAALVTKVGGAARVADSRPPSSKELAETAVLALPLHEVSVRARTGGPIEEPADEALPHWAGVLPLRLTAGRAQPAAGVTGPTPDYLRPTRSPWLTPAPMRGARVALAPLDVSHVDGLYAATADDEVWRWLSSFRPRSREDAAAVVRAALDAHELGQRVPWVQLRADTGEVIGTTSYYAVDPANRCVAIGYSILGSPWWRTGVNTESKLLLMRRAFEDLGAVRVEWHTDVHNERSQRAIERLGAVREGIMRSHKRRPDGTWRDTVLYSMTADEWPAARTRLTARLAAG